MTQQIHGAKELAIKLSEMGRAAGGKALRSAVMSASLPALRAAQAAAPVGNPPYNRSKDGGSVDPYPKRTYKGRLTIPGFTRQSVARKSWLSKDGRIAAARIGVKAEAFYAIQFVEFGTSKLAKKPWLEPSFRASQNAMGSRLKERLKQLIDKAARK